MRRLPALAATAAAAVLLAHPSSAAGKAFRLTDPAGDANGINSQGLDLVPVPSTATPVQLAGADITSLTLTNRFKGRKLKGFDVTLKLAAPLQQGVLITLTMDTAKPCGDSSRIQLAAGTSSLAICQSADPGGDSTTVGETEVSSDRTSVTWYVDNLFPAGTKITNFNATTSVFVLGVFDELLSSKSFSYGK